VFIFGIHTVVCKTMRRIARPRRLENCHVVRLRQAHAEQTQRSTDPLRDKVEAAVRGKESIGTGPLLDLLDLSKTTRNARRIGATMRALGFVPIKSRRFLPGGYRDTVTRGWTRPLRKPGQSGGCEAGLAGG
jgi:hypothetical protein